MSQPGNFGAGWPADDSYLIRRVQELERRVTELAAARTLESASIGAGGLQIINGGSLDVIDPNAGRVTAHFGTAGFTSTPADGATKQMITALYRDDGTLAVSLADLNSTPGHARQQFLGIWDRAGNTIVSDDTNGGVGLASPYIPISFTDANLGSGVAVATSAWTQVAVGGAYKMNPRLLVQVVVSSDAVGTTGNVRVMANGVQVGTTLAVAANVAAFAYIGPDVVAGNFRDWVGFSLDAQRTAGTGNIRARVVAAIGVQSP